jgi:hypothetical protein
VIDFIFIHFLSTTSGPTHPGLLQFCAWAYFDFYGAAAARN